MKYKKQIKNCIILIYLFIIFLYMLYLNIHIHKYHDEFVYTFIYGTTEKCKNLLDVFTSLKNLYLMHNGRIISTGIMCTLLMFPKILSDLLNSLFFTLLVFIIYKYSEINLTTNNTIKYTSKNTLIIENKKLYITNVINNLLNLFLIFPILWCTIPEFNGTVTWFSGSINYLWSTVFMLIYLYNFKKQFIYNINISKTTSIILCIFAFIIGSLHEATGIIVTSFLFFIFIYNIIKEHKLNYTFLLCCVFSFIGFLTIILAPGVTIRSIATTSNNPINHYVTFLNSLHMLKNMILNNSIILTLLFILIFTFNIKNGVINSLKNKNFIINIFFILCPLLVYLGMAFSPTFAERVTFFPYIMILISFFNLLNLIDIYNITKIIIKIFLFIYFSYFAINSIYETTNIAISFYNEWKARDNYIIQKNMMGEKDIQVTPFSTKLNNKIYGGDISDSLSYNHNGSMAMYYGLNSIRLKKNFYIDLIFCNLSKENNLDEILFSNNYETCIQTISILPENVFRAQAPYKRKKHSYIGGNITLYYGLNSLDNLRLKINTSSNKLCLQYLHIYNYKNIDYCLTPSLLKKHITDYSGLKLTYKSNYLVFNNFNDNPYIDLNLNSFL